MGAVLLERHASVAHLVLNAPEKRNALSRALRSELLAQLVSLDADPSCRAIVLSGAGGAFCAGGDITEMGAARTPLERRRILDVWREPIRLLTRGPRMVVAAVDGPAAGAGFSLAMLCDIVVAGPSARFSAAFGRIGLMPDLGLLWSLPARIGPARAKHLMVTGETVDAPCALALGIADHLAAAGDTTADALARAARYAEAAPGSVAMIKASLGRWPSRLDDVLDAEADGQALLGLTRDHAEGKQAFREKRPPLFNGV